jgi:outer membrane biosynthesis protein TonB
MPGVVEALRAKIGRPAVVRIEIDERGRAISVTIVSGLDDPALRDEVREQLAAASYIPARCNGVDCPDTLTLRL